MPAKSKRTKGKKTRKRQQKANLGQKEAEQRLRSESKLSHMGGSSKR
jgi:hypothetical protein